MGPAIDIRAPVETSSCLLDEASGPLEGILAVTNQLMQLSEEGIEVLCVTHDSKVI